MKISPIEFHLLKKETEALGEFTSKERIERKAEIDQLKMEVEAIRQTLEQIFPGFLARHDQVAENLRHEFDPERRAS